MVIYKDKFQKFVFECDKIVKYTKPIFGNRWQFAEVVKDNLTLENAKEIKKQIKIAMSK